MEHINWDTNVAAAALAGAFVGAIVTFIFDRLSDFLKSIRESNTQNHNGLVKAERYLVKHGGIISDDIYQIPGFQKALKLGVLYWSRLTIIPHDDDISLPLKDITLVNALHSYGESLRKINEDMAALTRAYETIESAFLQGTMSEVVYRVNANGIAGQLETVKVFLEELQEGTYMDLVARVQVLARHSSERYSERIRRWLNSQEGVSDKELNDQRKVVSVDIEDNATVSKQNIAKVRRRVKAEAKNN